MTQQDIVHHHLCSRPYLLARLKGELIESFKDIDHQLVNGVCILLELQGLDTAKESQIFCIEVGRVWGLAFECHIPAPGSHFLKVYSEGWTCAWFWMGGCIILLDTHSFWAPCRPFSFDR